MCRWFFTHSFQPAGRQSVSIPARYQVNQIIKSSAFDSHLQPCYIMDGTMSPQIVNLRSQEPRTGNLENIDLETRSMPGIKELKANIMLGIGQTRNGCSRGLPKGSRGEQLTTKLLWASKLCIEPRQGIRNLNNSFISQSLRNGF